MLHPAGPATCGYTLESFLGAGAFGRVFTGRDITTKGKVAIKLEPVSKELTKHPQLVYEAKVIAEIHALWAKNHPEKRHHSVQCIPRVLWHGEWTDSRLKPPMRFNALVMQRLGRPTVGDHVRLPLSLSVVGHIVRGVLRALEVVHAAGYAHRDIKPENILWERSDGTGNIFLIDFGLSKKVVYADGVHIKEREKNKLIGTPRYVSLRGHQGRGMSRRDDIEAVGYVALYLALGSLPWQTNDPPSIDKEPTKEDNKAGGDKSGLYSSVGSVKGTVSIPDLTKDLPKAFRRTIEYGRKGMHYEDLPDHERLQRWWQDV